MSTASRKVACSLNSTAITASVFCKSLACRSISYVWQLKESFQNAYETDFLAVYVHLIENSIKIQENLQFLWIKVQGHYFFISHCISELFVIWKWVRKSMSNERTHFTLWQIRLMRIKKGHLPFQLSEMGFLSIIMQQVGILPSFKLWFCVFCIEIKWMYWE